VDFIKSDRISTGREGGTSDDRIALSRVMSGDGAMVRANPSKRDEGMYTCPSYYHQRINVLPRELVRSVGKWDRLHWLAGSEVMASCLGSHKRVLSCPHPVVCV
jgi:hypothetical protein